MPPAGSVWTHDAPHSWSDGGLLENLRKLGLVSWLKLSLLNSPQLHSTHQLNPTSQRTTAGDLRSYYALMKEGSSSRLAVAFLKHQEGRCGVQGSDVTLQQLSCSTLQFKPQVLNV